MTKEKSQVPCKRCGRETLVYAKGLCTSCYMILRQNTPEMLEKRRIYQKEYRKNNLERVRKYFREWRKNNLDKIENYKRVRDWKKNNQDKVEKYNEEIKNNTRESVSPARTTKL